jgi:hypothetical protein
MIYDSLDILPYKIFLKIIDTGNVSLLTDEKIDENVLVLLWKTLYEEHLDKNESVDFKKSFFLTKEIDFFTQKKAIVLMCCDSLRFCFDQDLLDLLKELGHEVRTLDTETFLTDLIQVEREAKVYDEKITVLQNRLPKSNKENNSNIDDVMASYSSILGFDFDYNTISYTKFYALNKQVLSKIKIFESQNQTING